jgi:hypothetical protein
MEPDDSEGSRTRGVMHMRWQGWYALGAILMMIAGGFKFISGIIGLFRDEWLVLGYNGYMLVDITGLAVWWLIVGAILFLGGMAAAQGKTWGRIVGIVGASLAAVSEFFMLSVTPIWSAILVALYVLVLIAFIVVKQPAEE